ncbi:hypothetical protein LR48_Vigan317s000200 [Vigna angularis]|uniref:Uncharacterized protein n=1 Tax=Phaseolus angularis TaxID=3914 RepID=A0A0L9T8S4_PHAAN|nr:hypothetical protein LR48_Vigan317s000200 [Vigna angularis]
MQPVSVHNQHPEIVSVLNNQKLFNSQQPEIVQFSATSATRNCFSGGNMKKRQTNKSRWTAVDLERWMKMKIYRGRMAEVDRERRSQQRRRQQRRRARRSGAAWRWRSGLVDRERRRQQRRRQQRRRARRSGAAWRWRSGAAWRWRSRATEAVVAEVAAEEAAAEEATTAKATVVTEGKNGRERRGRMGEHGGRRSESTEGRMGEHGGRRSESTREEEDVGPWK